MITTWLTDTGGKELALAFDHGRNRRILVLPALFEEANKLRHFTVEVMRRLDLAGVDTFLPDLPGCNESLIPLEAQTVESWRDAARQSAHHFEATSVLAIRVGCLLAPPELPVWRYAPATGASILRGLLRSRLISSKEAGIGEDREILLDTGRKQGIELAGFHLSPAMVRDLEAAEPPAGAAVANIQQGDLGGPGLWLRAEPDFDSAQADALARIIAAGPAG